jgi:hypothetical protein
VETITIVVFITSGVVSLVASNIIMCLIQDIYHIIPEPLARRFKMSGKTLSTSTLACQVVSLALSTISLIIPLSFLVVFVFTKGSMAVVTLDGVMLECPASGPLNTLCIPIIYAETPNSAFLDPPFFLSFFS